MADGTFCFSVLGLLAPLSPWSLLALKLRPL